MPQMNAEQISRSYAVIAAGKSVVSAEVGIFRGQRAEKRRNIGKKPILAGLVLLRNTPDLLANTTVLIYSTRHITPFAVFFSFQPETRHMSIASAVTTKWRRDLLSSNCSHSGLFHSTSFLIKEIKYPHQSAEPWLITEYRTGESTFAANLKSYFPNFRSCWKFCMLWATKF